MQKLTIVAHDFYATIRNDYLASAGNDLDLLKSRLATTIKDRPIKNKMGIELKNNDYNKNIDLLEWLVNTSWSYFIQWLVKEADAYLKPYGGYMGATYAEKYNATVTIMLGSLPQSKHQFYMDGLAGIISSLNATLKHTTIKTVSTISNKIDDNQLTLI